MPREFNELQAEHAYIVSESKAVIEQAKAENRDLTAAEVAANDTRFAKARTIQLGNTSPVCNGFDGQRG